MHSIRLALLVLATSAFVAFSPATFGVFRNETDSGVIVTVVNTRGETSRPHFIPARGVASFSVTNGTAVARTTSGRRLASCDLMPLPIARDYYDFPSRSFYYRVTRDHIQLVRPESAREWLGSGLTKR